MLLAVEVLYEASIKLECKVNVRIRALVLFHHFMRCSSQKSVLGHNEIMVAAAALKCASRYEEQNLDYDDIVLIFYSVVNKTLEVHNPDDPEYLALKKSLITVDHIMQRKLEYVFSHRLAHQFMVPFLCFILERNYRLAQFHESVSDSAMKFANDMYTDPLCLNYKPDHLAIACIHAALHVHGLLKDMELLEPWFQGFSRDLTINKLREIKVFLFGLYKDEKEAVEDSEVLFDDNMEKENLTVEQKPDEEAMLKLEVDWRSGLELELAGGADKRKYKDHTRRYISREKKRRSKRTHLGKSYRRHRGKRRCERSSNKGDDRDQKNPEEEGKNKNESENNNNEEDKIKNDADRSNNEGSNNENEADQNRRVGENCMEESKMDQEKSCERMFPERSNTLKKEVENNDGERREKTMEDGSERTSVGEDIEILVPKGEELSSGKNVTTIDLELSA